MQLKFPFLRYFPALAAGGKVFPLTISTEALQIEPLTMNLFNFQVIGSGLSPISGFRDMLAFSAKHGIRPQIEKFPMTQAGVIEAMQKLRNGNMRYRGVLVAP
jgi:D-arabinose 1-dehydrogenase-like Zn-dependent alcohol dehydrogenase